MTAQTVRTEPYFERTSPLEIDFYSFGFGLSNLHSP